MTRVKSGGEWRGESLRCDWLTDTQRGQTVCRAHDCAGHAGRALARVPEAEAVVDQTVCHLYNAPGSSSSRRHRDAPRGLSAGRERGRQNRSDRSPARRLSATRREIDPLAKSRASSSKSDAPLVLTAPNLTPGRGLCQQEILRWGDACRQAFRPARRQVRSVSGRREPAGLFRREFRGTRRW